MTELSKTLSDLVRDALREVIDPELGMNIVDVGLVYDVAVDEERRAKVLLTTTTRGCPATDYLYRGAHEAASRTPGIVSATVELTYDPPWSPEMMSEQAQEALGFW